MHRLIFINRGDIILTVINQTSTGVLCTKPKWAMFSEVESWSTDVLTCYLSYTAGLVINKMEELNVTAAHLNNETVPVFHNLEFWRWLFTLDSGIGWIGPGFAYVSGVVLDVILTIMVVCSMSFVRKNGYFQVSTATRLWKIILSGVILL